jgi:hypothetical protein
VSDIKDRSADAALKLIEEYPIEYAVGNKHHSPERAVAVIAAALRRYAAECVAAEREACAKEAERLAEPIGGRASERHDGAWVALTRAAAAIRARVTP